MGLLQCILGRSDKTPVASTLDGNEVNGIEAERLSDISEVADQETTTTQTIKTQPNVCCLPVLQMALASLSYETRNDVCSETYLIACKPKSLDDLPDEILLKILSYFGPEDLVVIIAKVCKRWNDLAKGVVLWKTLSYTCDKYSDINAIEEVLREAPALHSLIVRERKDVARIMEFLFHIRGYVRKLILENSYLGDRLDLAINMVTLYPDLEVLSLENSHPLTSDVYCLIPRLKKLSELNLSYCEGLSGEPVRLIADSCQHLKKLNLGVYVSLIDADVIHVIKKLGKQLTTLDLDGDCLTDVAYSYLKNCARLQELRLFRCQKMTDRGLLEGIGSLQGLRHLRLNLGLNLTARALSTFLLQPSMTSILSLDLSFCENLDDEGLKGIAERCIHLKELDISFCRHVTDAGVSMVINHCNLLRALKLRLLTSITGEGWLSLVPSLLPHLRELCLRQCYSVCFKYVEELHAAVPKLKID